MESDEQMRMESDQMSASKRHLQFLSSMSAAARKEYHLEMLANVPLERDLSDTEYDYYSGDDEDSACEEEECREVILISDAEDEIDMAEAEPEVICISDSSDDESDDDSMSGDPHLCVQDAFELDDDEDCIV